MQKQAQADKRRAIIDGVEYPGLVSCSDVNLEKGQIEVPEFKVLRKISNGVSTIPALDLVYRLDRDTETKKMIENWWNNDELHDVIVIYTDGHGNEFKRELWTQCELVKKSAPAYDASQPTFMQYQITILPWSIIDIE